jgi:hypothetical protein
MVEHVATTSIESPTVTLEIFERARIWRVSLNGRFYGDYTRREWAKQAAAQKARQLLARGVSARVQITDPRTQPILETGRLGAHPFWPPSVAHAGPSVEGDSSSRRSGSSTRS